MSMNSVGHALLVPCLAALLACTALLTGAGQGYAQAGDDPTPAATTAATPTASATPDTLSEVDTGVTLLIPDLVTSTVSDLRLIFDPNTGRRTLRFSNTIANIGNGVMELRGETAVQAGRYRVSQLLYGSNGDVLVEPLVEQIIFHSGHDHWHLDGFASYEVWRATNDGRLLDAVRVRGKISYCLFDHRAGSDTPPSANYSTCQPELQGLSPGWTDTYAQHLAGQWVDLSGLEDGVYVLRSVVNPRGVLRELTRENNDMLVAFRLSGSQFTPVSLAEDPWSLLGPHPDQAANPH